MYGCGCAAYWQGARGNQRRISRWMRVVVCMCVCLGSVYICVSRLWVCACVCV